MDYLCTPPLVLHDFSFRVSCPQPSSSVELPLFSPQEKAGRAGDVERLTAEVATAEENRRSDLIRMESSITVSVAQQQCTITGTTRIASPGTCMLWR